MHKRLLLWGGLVASASIVAACDDASTSTSDQDASGGSTSSASSSPSSGTQAAGACGATADGESETRACFEAASVPNGERCQSTIQTRTCAEGSWSPDFPACAHLSCVVEGPVATPGTIFPADFERGEPLDDLFSDVNTYGGVVVDLSTDVARSGTTAVKITYPTDEAGVELKPAPFAATPSLYARKYEYFAPGWEGNWPVGLKTSRYFTRDDFSTGMEPESYAYASEKLVWQTYDGDPNDTYGRGLNVAIFDLDLEAT